MNECVENVQQATTMPRRQEGVEGTRFEQEKHKQQVKWI
jgi:hypothetical protein